MLSHTFAQVLPQVLPQVLLTLRKWPLIISELSARCKRCHSIYYLTIYYLLFFSSESFAGSDFYVYLCTNARLAHRGEAGGLVYEKDVRVCRKQDI